MGNSPTLSWYIQHETADTLGSHRQDWVKWYPTLWRRHQLQPPGDVISGTKSCGVHSMCSKQLEMEVVRGARERVGRKSRWVGWWLGLPCCTPSHPVIIPSLVKLFFDWRSHNNLPRWTLLDKSHPLYHPSGVDSCNSSYTLADFFHILLLRYSHFNNDDTLEWIRPYNNIRSFLGMHNVMWEVKNLF